MDKNYELINPTELVVTKSPTGLWDISEPTLPQRPIEHWAKGTVFTARAVYNHPTGEFYVRKRGDKEGIKSDEADPVRQAVSYIDMEKNRYLYKVLKGETIWDIARRFKLSATELLDNNGVDDWHSLRPGDVLLLPTPLPEGPREIEYDIYETPQLMHVSFPRGTQRIAFGNVAKWSDLKPSGRFSPHGTNIVIVGAAKVPIGDTELATFYLDAWALGNYHESGHLAYLMGYNHKHLKAGEYVPFTPQPVQADPDPPEEPEPVLESTSDYKATYRVYDEPIIYTFTEDVMVHELDGRRPPKKKYQYDEVSIAGTFLVNRDGQKIMYGRPTGAVRPGYWFAVPMDKLTMSAEVYSYETTKAERFIMGQHFTPLERYGSIPFARFIARYTSIMEKLRK